MASLALHPSSNRLAIGMWHYGAAAGVLYSVDFGSIGAGVPAGPDPGPDKRPYQYPALPMAATSACRRADLELSSQQVPPMYLDGNRKPRQGTFWADFPWLKDDKARVRKLARRLAEIMTAQMQAVRELARMPAAEAAGGDGSDGEALAAAELGGGTF